MHTKKTHIHFVGIGGIGMSGLATIFHHKGYTISGCDPDINQETVKQLIKFGCAVFQGNNSMGCHDHSIEVLVYIPMYATTIPAVEAEIKRAQERNIPILSRAQMLSQLMQEKYSIAISGSHGKTTTTALISHILLESHYDPTIVVGGYLKNIKAQARIGNGKFLVAEADESDRSFLDLWPMYAVITNIDLEHLETYKDLNDIKDSFVQFLYKIPTHGKAIVCIDNENIQSIMSQLKNKQTVTYGILQKADFSAQDIQLYPHHSIFTVYKNNTIRLGAIHLPIAGQHNIYNTLAAIAISQEIGIDFAMIQKNIASFAGVERRFSFMGTYKKAEVFDDYGHHPLEIQNTLIVAHKKKKNNLIVVFQPHRYTRTQKLWNEFISTFAYSDIDTLIITDIYSAGEKSLDGITSESLVNDIRLKNPSLNISYIPLNDNFESIKSTLHNCVSKNDLLLFLGAGKTYQIAQSIVE